MAEEQRCQEGHRLCVNNCGFFGSSATMNLCSKCFRDYCLKEQQQASIKASLSTTSSSSPSPVTGYLPLAPPVSSPEVNITVTQEQTPLPQPSRCLICKKRVRLTGFKCRCESTFCGTHRYPEKHNCSFDFMTVGKEEIARANPVVVAEKLRKI